MRVKAQIKVVLLVTITAFFMLSGLGVAYIGLFEIINFGGIYINFFNVVIWKELIFYSIGIFMGIALISIINTYIRPGLKNVQ